MYAKGPKRAQKSIAVSFILVVLLIITIGQGAAWVWFLFSEKKDNQEAMERKARMVAEFITELSDPSMSKQNFRVLGRYADRIMKDEDIIALKVLDTEDNIILQRDSSIKGGEMRARSLNPLYMPWTNKLSIPIISSGGEIGVVEVTYSGKSANDMMFWNLTIPPIVEGIVFLVIVYAIYFFFQRQIGNPIGILQENIERVTAGDLTVRMPELENNELGIIAGGLNYLIEGLSETATKLEATASKVTGAIKDLDETFSKSIKMIKEQSEWTEDISVSLRAANQSLGEIKNSSKALSGFSSENLSSLLEMKAVGDETVLNMDGLFEASEKSYAVIASMLRSSKAITENARNVLDSIETTSASLEEIAVSVRDVEVSAKESSQLAENVKDEAARKGVLTVAEAVTGMERITKKVKYSVELVRRLETRSQDVQRILSVIREITEQTNLLSLNASILSEQAGEYGKGFSVVADEMRALSDRTAAYTKEIGGIIATIQREIHETVESIEVGMQMAKEGSEIVYRVGETMSSILENSHESANMAGNIERATEEQASSLDYIAKEMSNINSMTQNMSKTMEEQLESFNFMVERVGDVKDVAETTRKSAIEQAEGTGLISHNLEVANEKVEGINKAVFGQQTVNDEILDIVDKIRSAGALSVTDMKAVSVSLDRLRKEFDTLKKEVDRLRVRK
jgi:methyl-accepting chemotaxis protein